MFVLFQLLPMLLMVFADVRSESVDGHEECLGKPCEVLPEREISNEEEMTLQGGWYIDQFHCINKTLTVRSHSDSDITRITLPQRILVDNGNLTLHGLYFRGFQSGVIAVTSTGTLIISDCIFESNSAIFGGVVRSKGHVIMRNSKFISNRAEKGGVIFTARDNLHIDGSEFLNNSAAPREGDDGANKTYDGGAILCQDCVELHIRNSSFVNNSANGTGGAIWQSSAQNFEVIDSVFSNNSAKDGGAIFTQTVTTAATITCQNMNDWVDSDGDDCERYELFNGDSCAQSSEFSVNGIGAAEACCHCGGGKMADFEYVGCFHEEEPLSMSEEFYGGPNFPMTVPLCCEHCTRSGSYTHFALQHHEMCFCGYDTYDKYGTSEDCTTNCRGDSSTICGGSWANSVYKIIETCDISVGGRFSHASGIAGTYAVHGQLNGHPTYRNRATGLSVYFFKTAEGKGWIIGEGGSMALGFHRHWKARKPELVEGPWLVWNGTNFAPELGIFVTCSNQACLDVEWSDSEGRNCEFYAGEKQCKSATEFNTNMDATQACCACGGGTFECGDCGDPSSTKCSNSRIAKCVCEDLGVASCCKGEWYPACAEIAVTQNCCAGSSVCIDLDWRDRDGDGCSAYERAGNWSCVESALYKYNGVGANESCCFCGGGKLRQGVKTKENNVDQVPADSKEICPIEISGRIGYNDLINGIYGVLQEEVDGAPTFRNKESGLYLYYNTSEKELTGKWKIGNELGGNKMFAFISTSAMLPQLADGTWRLWEEVWVDDSEVSIGCSATDPFLDVVYDAAKRPRRDDMVIRNCSFELNNASASGGAIFAHSGILDIVKTNFSRNTAYDSGGALRQEDAQLTFEGCLIEDNHCLSMFGGGCYFFICDSVKLVNSTFNSNRAGISGEALYCQSDDNFQIENCEFTDNDAVHGKAFQPYDKNPDIPSQAVTNSIENQLNYLNTRLGPWKYVDPLSSLTPQEAYRCGLKAALYAFSPGLNQTEHSSELYDQLAIQYFKASSKLPELFDSSHLNIGLIYLKIGDSSLAEVHFHELSSNTTYWMAQRILMFAYCDESNGNIDDAKDKFQQAIELDGNIGDRFWNPPEGLNTLRHELSYYFPTLAKLLVFHRMSEEFGSPEEYYMIGSVTSPTNFASSTTRSPSVDIQFGYDGLSEAAMLVEQNHHIVLQNFLSPIEVNIVQSWYDAGIHENALDGYEDYLGRTTSYYDRIGAIVNAQQLEMVEKITQKQHEMSYSYLCAYHPPLDEEDAKDAPRPWLRPHTDREDNAFTVSLQIHSAPNHAPPWPLYVDSTEVYGHAAYRPQSPAEVVFEAPLNVGDALLFYGRMHTHWRERLPEQLDSVSTLLLHFVEEPFDFGDYKRRKTADSRV